MGFVGNLREKIRSSGRATLISLIVIPVICIGLSFVGIQTYNWITGQPLTPFSFDIGSLWSNDSKQSPQNEVLVKKTTPILPFLFKPVVQDDEPKNRGVSIPKISVKNRSYNSPLTVVNQTSSEQAVTFDPTNFPNLRKEMLDVNALKPLKKKYLNRLKQDYLISPEITPDSKKWYVGFSLAPMLSYRTFNFRGDDVSGVTVSGNTRYSFGLTRDQRNRTDQVLPSFSLGIDVGRNITSKLSIRTGVYYATYGEQLQIKQVNHKDPNYENSEYHGRNPEYEAYSSFEENEEGIPFSNRYAYFEIPFGIEYKVINIKNTHISLDLGAAIQRLDHVDALVYDVETDYYYWFSNKHGLFRALNYNASGAIVVSQYVGNTLELFISPRLIYNLQSTYSDEYPIDQKQYSSGLKLGFKQHF